MHRGETWEEQFKQPEEHGGCTKIIGILQFAGKNSKGGCEACLQNHESTKRTLEKLKPEVHLESKWKHSLIR